VDPVKQVGSSRFIKKISVTISTINHQKRCLSQMRKKEQYPFIRECTWNMLCHFFKQPKIDSNQHDATAATFNSPRRTFLLIVVSVKITLLSHIFELKS